MPIHALATTRRRFLLGSAATVMAAARGAAALEEDPLEWALLSDTHISGNRNTERSGVRMAENLERAIDQILSGPTRPAAVLINGDAAYLTGSHDDYATLADMLRRFSSKEVPLHLTLGNHDRRESAWAGLAQYAQPAPAPLADRQASIVETPHANWFLLDSLDRVNRTPGELGERQRHWLAKALDARKEKPAIVVAHHNLSEIERVRHEEKTILAPADRLLPVPGLKDTSLTLDLLVSRPHVVAYVCGHTHQWNIREWRGIQLINLPTTAYTFLPADPTGWVRCRSTANGLTLELVAFNEKHPMHGRPIKLEWKRGPGKSEA